MIARDALWKVGAVVVLLAAGNAAPAAIVRFHYVADAPGGCMRLVPGPSGAPGELLTVVGRYPYNCPLNPTCNVTFHHCFSGATIVVPLALPDGTPQLMHRSNRTIYNYGSYTVTVVFNPDGSVDVVYNSGLLRAI